MLITHHLFRGLNSLRNGMSNQSFVNLQRERHIKRINVIVEISNTENKLLDHVRNNIDPERFVAYGVEGHLLTTSVWDGNCRLLVLTDGRRSFIDDLRASTEKKTHDSILNPLERYLKRGGDVAFIPNGDPAEECIGALIHHGIASKARDEGSASHGYLWCLERTPLLNEPSIATRLQSSTLSQSKLKLIFHSITESEHRVEKNEENNELYVRVGGNTDEFNVEIYKSNLSTVRLGRHLLFFPRVTSSMDVLDGPPLLHGIVVIPDRQTQGRGRGNNVWLSPKGCAMFSIQLELARNTRLATKPSFTQHLLALAIVHSIRRRPEYAALDIRIKWPNDIYFGSSIKLGGIILNCSTDGRTMHVNAGAGFNLNNEAPTASLNEILASQGLGNDASQSAPALDRETYLASVFNTLEELIDKYNDGGSDEIMSLYYRYWLHSQQMVTVETLSEGSISAVIQGVDEFGFLRVKSSADGSEFQVQDDGNSFDMLEGLIRPKY